MGGADGEGPQMERKFDLVVSGTEQQVLRQPANLVGWVGKSRALIRDRLAVLADYADVIQRKCSSAPQS